MSNLQDGFIKLRNGQCFKCGNNIHIYDFEATDYELNTDGIASSQNLISYKVFGVCPICGTTYPVRRHGMGFIIDSEDPIFRRTGGMENVSKEKNSVNLNNEFGYAE